MLESISGRLAPNPDAEEDNLLSSSYKENEKQYETSSEQHSEAINKNDSELQVCNDQRKLAGLKTKTAGPSHVQTSERKNPSISPENDLVSSTFKDDDEIQLQPTQSQCVSEPKCSDDDKSESTAYEDSEGHSHSEQNVDSKSESTFISQNTSDENNTNSEQTLDDYDADDADDVRERRNPKLCVERELPQQQFDDSNKPKQFSSHNNFQNRNRHLRPQMQRPPYCGGDFNPSFMGQYRGARRPMLPNQPDFFMGHSLMMRGLPNMQRGIPPGMPMHSRMPGGPGLLGPPHSRLPRPPFQSAPGMYGNNPGLPPQGKFYS